MRERTSRGGLVGLLVSGLVVMACGQLAGLEDPAPAAVGSVGVGPDGGAPLPDVEIGPTELTFDEAACGAEPPAKIVTLRNKGDVPTDYKFELGDGTPFRVDGPTQGVLQPQAPLTVRVLAKPLTPGQVGSDLVVSAGASLQTVKLQTTGKGATFEPVTPLVDFGDVRYQTGGKVDVLVRNTGTEPLIIPQFTGQANGFDVSWDGKPSAFTVAPAQTGTLQITFAGGNETPAALSAQLTPTITGAVCGAVKPLAVSGKRVNLDVTVSPVDFGKQACNTTPGAKELVITNYANTVVSFAADALPAASLFTYSGASAGSVPAGSGVSPTTAKILVVPKPVGVNLGPHNETINVVISAAGLAPPTTGPRPVTVSLDVRGAIVSANPTSITNFSSSGYYWDARNVAITNSGVDPVSVSWVFSRPAGPAAWNYTFPGTLPVGNSNGTMRFAPTGGCGCEAKLKMQVTAGILCSTPLELSFSGSRTY